MGNGNGNDDARRLILARRARFVAAAVAGITVACGGATEQADPQPCLRVAQDGGGPRDASTDVGEPQVCLDVDAPPDAGPDGPTDSGPDTSGPRPCLSMLPPDAGDGGS